MRRRVVVGPEVVRPPFWDVDRLTFGRARLLWTDGQIVLDHWRYDDLSAAVVAALRVLLGIDTAPTGWMRHPPTGRCRPKGRAEAEYVLA